MSRRKQGKPQHLSKRDFSHGEGEGGRWGQRNRSSRVDTGTDRSDATSGSTGLNGVERENRPGAPCSLRSVETAAQGSRRVRVMCADSEERKGVVKRTAEQLAKRALPAAAPCAAPCATSQPLVSPSWPANPKQEDIWFIFYASVLACVSVC
ncbi:hypothetical protein EYF80_066578 [Liparis tanakae]|uniref:Uncharacterized protein n=1 Tax=Liparis tanakae TaxID=230148 RepID=A0A4Z2E3L8_9TELE|nr:hypothetical protein EYF80_066578 [Liparis tanakae]